MVIDTETMRPALAGVTGGLSGPAIRPLALRCVWQVHAALPEVPLFGIGGIRTGLDALQFILAGASAVQVGTVIFNDPGAPSRISGELRDALAARGMSELSQAIGLAHRAGDQLVVEGPEPVGAREPEYETDAPTVAHPAAVATVDEGGIGAPAVDDPDAWFRTPITVGVDEVFDIEGISEDA
jgi:Dihydroorotate dehydrogenase